MMNCVLEVLQLGCTLEYLGELKNKISMPGHTADQLRPIRIFGGTLHSYPDDSHVQPRWRGTALDS